MKNHAIAEHVGMSEIWVKTKISRLIKEKILTTKWHTFDRTIFDIKQKRIETKTSDISIGAAVYNRPTFSTTHGLKEGWIRHTIIMKKEQLENLNYYSKFSLKKMKDIFCEALSEYIVKNSEIIEQARGHYAQLLNKKGPLQI
jgi:hypothetical protein